MKTSSRIEPLEARIAPAAYTWFGGIGSWNDPSAWRRDSTGLPDGTFPNGNDDSVTFDNLGDANLATITGAVVINKFTAVGNATTEIRGGTLTFEAASGTPLLELTSGSLTMSGAVDVNTGLDISVAAGRDLMITGRVIDFGDAGPLTKLGTGTLTFSGTNSNDYVGETRVQAGKLVLSKSTGVDAFRGDALISTGATLETTVAKMIKDTATISLAGTGTLKLGADETINSLTGTGGLLDLGGHVLTLGAAGVSYAGGFASDGTLKDFGGTITLTGTDAAAHTIALSFNTFAKVTGSYAAVNFNATGGGLFGDGTVGAFTGDGSTVAPFGSSNQPATLSVKSLGFTGTGVDYSLDIEDGGADQVVVRPGGTVALGGADGTLSLNFTATAALDQSFTLIDNQGSQPVSGTFKDVPEGTVFTFGGIDYVLTYAGGDGNDVVLSSATAKATVSADGKTATFTDLDGDAVTIKSSTGGLTVDRIKLTPENAIGGASVRLLDFTNAVFAGSNITLTAKPAPRTGSLGDGFANVLRLDAGANALGIVKIDGDLAEIDAGAVKSLTVASIGLANDGGGSSLTSLGALTVKTGIKSAGLKLTGALGAVKVGGSVDEFALTVGAQAGAVSIAGDLSDSVLRIAGVANPTAKTALALKSLTVGGSLDRTSILLGYDGSDAVNADVQAGAVKVKGAWIASSFIAGTAAGADGLFGTADDAAIAGGNAIIAKIASITIGGIALGDTGPASYGIVAQQIGALKVGKAKAALTSGLDVLALGFTRDFFAREVA